MPHVKLSLSSPFHLSLSFVKPDIKSVPQIKHHLRERKKGLEAVSNSGLP